MNLSVEEKLGPGLSRLVAGFDSRQRERVSAAMGSEVRQLIVFHLGQLAVTRHATARRLGASPTGYIAQLAENFDQVSTVTVDDDGVSISMRHPIIARALRDVTITKPGGFLAIPVHGSAYGVRAAEMWLRRDLFIAKGMIFEKRPGDEPPLALYALKRTVTQKRDPSLLPSIDNLYRAAARGAGREVKAILREAALL